jgi:hypothetical protein
MMNALQFAGVLRVLVESWEAAGKKAIKSQSLLGLSLDWSIDGELEHGFRLPPPRAYKPPWSATPRSPLAYGPRRLRHVPSHSLLLPHLILTN